MSWPGQKIRKRGPLGGLDPDDFPSPSELDPPRAPSGDKGFPLWAWKCVAGHGWVSSSGTAKPCSLCGSEEVVRKGPA